MPSVAEVDAALVGALVRAVLQRDDGVSGPELLLGKVALVLVGLFRSDGNLAVLRAL